MKYCPKTNEHYYRKKIMNKFMIKILKESDLKYLSHQKYIFCYFYNLFSLLLAFFEDIIIFYQLLLFHHKITNHEIN